MRHAAAALTIAAACVEATSPATASQPKLSGVALYDYLYATGYHNKTTGSRALDLFPTLQNLTKSDSLASVLDIGCSHGYAVNWLWSLGIRASGVDISNNAIALAKRTRGEPADKCVGPCFQQGPATQLPWPNRSFEAIISSDVLEHLEPEDVDEAIGEIGRVASRFLVLKIAARHDSTPTYKTMDKETWSQLPGDLHPVVKQMPWWHAKFAHVGFKLRKTIPSRHWWTCCSFVMERVPD